MIWDIDNDCKHFEDMKIFLDPECVYCKNEGCFNPACKYKEIRNLAKTALEYPDNQQYLLRALEEIKLLTEFLIDGE
jgi:hypothetical protein